MPANFANPFAEFDQMIPEMDGMINDEFFDEPMGMGMGMGIGNGLHRMRSQQIDPFAMMQGMMGGMG